MDYVGLEPVKVRLNATSPTNVAHRRVLLLFAEMNLMVLFTGVSNQLQDEQWMVGKCT
jgi:hypothetical protein